MWWSISAGALVVIALVARKFLKRSPREFDAGSVSDTWLVEQKARKEGWY